MSASPFSAIILAGGQSSRMGRDKALLRWHGLPLWQYQQQLLKQLGCDDILLSHPHLGIADQHPDFGPLSGLQALVPLCQHAHILVLPVDMPLLTPMLLEYLLQQAELQPAHFHNHALPCVLHNTPELIRYLNRQMHPRGQRSVKSLLAFCEASSLECPWPETLANTNTPEDWQQVCPKTDAEKLP